MAEPKIGDYCYFLPELFEVRSIVRHQLYRIVEVTLNKRYGVPLTQSQPPNILDTAEISVKELNRMHQKIEEHQKKIDNSEIMGTAWARLEEELRQLKLETQRLSDQLLETKRLLEYAGNQRESCRRQVEKLNNELAQVTIVAETKTRECIALVDERECLARELENTEIDIRKLRTRVRTNRPQKRSSRGDWRRSTRRARSVDLRTFMSFYSFHRGPQPVLSRNVSKRWQCSVIRTRVVGTTCSKLFFRQRKLWKMRMPVIFMTSTGLKKQRNI